MTSKIKYTGFSHFRELAAADFKKLGVEGQKALTFARHEVMEVEDDVAEILTKFLGDEFEKVKEDAAKETQPKAKTTKGSTDSQPTNPPGHQPPASDSPSASASGA